MTDVVTRFAPSPTGHLHVGGARTALFNWALARRLGGRFLLRIEDTDQVRSSEDATRGIFEDLAWLGIGWDEGPVFGGHGGDPRGVGPFLQSERVALYDAALAELVERDLAYPAFETAAELEDRRREAQARKQAFRYRRPADWQRASALARMRSEPHVIRFRAPEQAIAVEDQILGPVEFPADQLDDFVLRKQDGFPTYHLAVVVDDERMGVTHVLRGQEHLNNTPRHVALQRALGFRIPLYAHLPLIQNPDGSKMSKREADTITVEDFRRAGYLPEVMVNFLALLGWSPGEKLADGRDREHFDAAFLAERFSLARVGRANARFDRAKLLAFSQQAIAALADDAFLARFSEWCARYAPGALAKLMGECARWFAAAVKPRARTLAEPTEPGGPGHFAVVGDRDFAYDPKAVEKHLRKGEPSGAALLAEVATRLAALPDFAPEAIEAAVAAFAAERGVTLGKVAQALRVAVTGAAASPPLGLTLAMLGREAVAARIERCLRGRS